MKAHAHFHRNFNRSWSQFLVSWVLFGALLAASWYWHPLFSLVCFVPYFIVLFQAEEKVTYYIQLFVLNLTWNAAVTYWICQLKPLKGVATLLTNSLLFLLPVLIWQLFSRRGFLKKGQALLLLACWLLFEYAHHVWDFSWTWLTIGNVFGSAPQWVLWYTYVGVLGGSVWILCCNYFIYDVARSSDRRITKWFLPAFAVLLPVVTSLGISVWRNAQPAGTVNYITAAAISIMDKDSISDIRKIRLIDSMLMAGKGSREIVLLPEVLLTDQVWLDRLPFSPQYALIKQYLNRWKTSHVIFGAQLNVADPVAPADADQGLGISAYNAALMIDTSDIISIKLKKVLVPVEEYVPSYLAFLNLKTYGFRTKRNNSDIFGINGRQYLIGICYEVVNSIFIASRVNQHTSAILMLSSESFFGPSEVGRVQYMNICRLRCLENNLPLVKSSNDGIVLSVGAGGDIQEAQRTFGPYLLNAAVRSPGVSFYHMIMPVIPWMLLFIVGGTLLVNVFSRIGAGKRSMKKSLDGAHDPSRLYIYKDDAVKT